MSLLDSLRPKPFRGAPLAAGVVVLATLVWVVAVRFQEAWSHGVLLGCALVALAFVLTLAVLAPMEDREPRAYQSVLYVASVALWMDAVRWLGEILTDDVLRPGPLTAELGVIAVFALWFAIRRNSAVCTLIGALAGGGAVLAAVAWLFAPDDRLATDRWVLLVLMVVYGFLAVGQRDRRLRHGVALIDAAGLSAVAIAGSFVVSAVFGSFAGPITGVAWGWELLTVAAGFGLIAYSSVDRQPGPAYLGVTCLVLFAAITSLGVTRHGATLVGWPIALALMAAFLLIVGLRPTTPAPPPPDADAPEAPPLPLR